MSGRKYFDRGETFQYDILSVCSHAERPDGEQLFREKFIIRPEMYPPSTLGAMNGYDVFANVIVLTRLPNDAGLLYKVLGEETAPVKRLVREFCSSVRQEVKGKPLPEEFPWR